MDYDDEPIITDPVVEELTGTSKTFTVKGKEKLEMKITRGNAGSCKISLPPDWIDKKITIIRQD